MKPLIKECRDEAILEDNYLVFSIEKIYDHMQDEKDIDVLDAIKLSLWIDRSYAEKIQKDISKDPNSIIDLRGLADIPNWKEFTWKIILDSKYQKRNHDMAQYSYWNWLSLNYSDLEKHEDRIIKNRHKEKIDFMKAMLAED